MNCLFALGFGMKNGIPQRYMKYEMMYKAIQNDCYDWTLMRICWISEGYGNLCDAEIMMAIWHKWIQYLVGYVYFSKGCVV